MMTNDAVRTDDARLTERRRLNPRLCYGALQKIFLQVRPSIKKLLWLTRIDATRYLRRFVDVTASVVLIIVLSPLLLLVAIGIKLESRGPALFRQIRIGHDAKPFILWKFRSMYTDAEQRRSALVAQHDSPGGIRFKMKQDPRITWMGRVIRRSSVDELPQLWNVLTGSMSLVGPRPPLPQEVQRYTQTERRRLSTVPGITCIWQVSGRADIPFHKQVLLDVRYIDSQSLWLDLLILFKTVPAVVFGRGAY